MREHTCDRCGKERNIFDNDVNMIMHYPSLGFNVINLCEDCQRELLEWMEKGVNDDREI